MSVTIESDFDPLFTDLRDFPGDEFSSDYFKEMLLSHIFGPSVVKFIILRNNRRRKLHAVIDCLFFSGGRQPPVITKFLQRDLVNPDEVKFQQYRGFSLPCEAKGSNLTWLWQHNGKKITILYGYPFSLGKSGTLIGRYLEAKHSGTYQCFVRDQVTGFQVFSRKLKVAVTGRNLLYFYYHILGTGMMPAEGNSHYLQLASWTRVFFLSFFFFIYLLFFLENPSLPRV